MLPKSTVTSTACERDECNTEATNKTAAKRNAIQAGELSWHG